MSNFLELRTEVLDITGRTDKVTAINRQINSVIRLISTSGKFWRDLQEVTLTATDGVDPASNVQAIVTPANYRHTLYLKYPADISTCPIEVIDIDSLLHPDYRAKTDIAYNSANHLHIRNKTQTAEFNLGYYSFPATLLNDTDSNWISELLPDVVIELSSAFIKTITGDQNTANGMSRLSSQKLDMYISDILSQLTIGV